MQLLEVSKAAPKILFLDTKTKQKLVALSLACPKCFVYPPLLYNLKALLVHLFFSLHHSKPTWAKDQKPHKGSKSIHSI